MALLQSAALLITLCPSSRSISRKPLICLQPLGASRLLMISSSLLLITAVKANILLISAATTVAVSSYQHLSLSSIDTSTSARCNRTSTITLSVVKLFLGRLYC